jgi:hypothetical protein
MMSSIKINRVTEVNLSLKLSEQEASELLYILRHGVTPPRVMPPDTPFSLIVRELATALLAAGVK